MGSARLCLADPSRNAPRMGKDTMTHQAIPYEQSDVLRPAEMLGTALSDEVTISGRLIERGSQPDYGAKGMVAEDRPAGARRAQCQWLPFVRKQLRAIAALPEGWDSYGAPRRRHHCSKGAKPNRLPESGRSCLCRTSIRRARVVCSLNGRSGTGISSLRWWLTRSNLLLEGPLQGRAGGRDGFRGEPAGHRPGVRWRVGAR